MKNSTLLSIFRLLKPGEIQLLAQLVNTPMFKLPNRHTDTVQLLDYLIPFAPNFDQEGPLDKPRVAQQLYGHRAQPETELRKAMSNLMGMVKKFILVQQVFQSQDTPDKEALQQILSDMELLKWLRARSGDISKTPASQTKKGTKPPTHKARLLLEQQYRAVKSATSDLLPPFLQFDQRGYSEWLLTAFWREFEMFDYFGAQRALPEQQAHLLLALEQLDTFYYQLKLGLTVHLQVNLAAFPSVDPFAQAHIDNVTHIVETPPAHLATDPNLAAYTATFKMMRDMGMDDAQYFRLDQLLLSGQVHLPQQVKQNLRLVQNAYCALMYNRTRQSVYLQRRFDLQKIDLENELLLSGNTITAMRLSGTVSNALFLGEQNFDWVARLLERFEHGRGILATETPREAYKVNRAHLLFYRRAYREAANELVGYDWYARITDLQTLLLAIRIDLKTQFELGHYDTDYFLRVLDTAEKRLVRLNDLDEQLRTMTLHFLRILKQIGAAKAKGKLFYQQEGWKNKLMEWKTFVIEKPIAEQPWLLVQIENLNR